MKLARFDLSDDSLVLAEQIEKFHSEVKEFDKSLVLGSMQDSVSEILDVIQSAFGILNILTPSNGQIEEAFAVHEAKMKQYEASGRVPKILGWVELKGVE